MQHVVRMGFQKFWKVMEIDIVTFLAWKVLEKRRFQNGYGKVLVSCCGIF